MGALLSVNQNSILTKNGVLVLKVVIGVEKVPVRAGLVLPLFRG